eukprot:9641989-Ditylum_brightwellii.AAC.2
MFGKNTWKDDEKRRGPSSTKECQVAKDVVAYKANEFSINTAVGEITKLVDGDELKAAVLCGDDMETCESNINVLQETENIIQV